MAVDFGTYSNVDIFIDARHKGRVIRLKQSLPLGLGDRSMDTVTCRVRLAGMAIANRLDILRKRSTVKQTYRSKAGTPNLRQHHDKVRSEPLEVSNERGSMCAQGMGSGRTTIASTTCRNTAFEVGGTRVLYG